MNDLVHIRLEPKMRTAIKDVISQEQFSSETDFIRDSIRKNLEYYKLEKFRGIAKEKTLTKEERLKGIADLENSKDIFRRFNLHKKRRV